ncbi:hypothetical protein [Lysinibacillus sphaericus]|nr:hypothetical protein [Lysinibacillus sphaericus]
MVVPLNGNKKVFFEGIFDGDGNIISGNITVVVQVRDSMTY